MTRQPKQITKPRELVSDRFEDWPSDWQEKARKLVERYEKEEALMDEGDERETDRKKAIRQLQRTLRKLNAGSNLLRRLAHPGDDADDCKAAAILSRAAQVAHRIPDDVIDWKVDEEHRLHLHLTSQYLDHHANLIESAIRLSQAPYSTESRGRPLADEVGLFIYRAANLYFQLTGRAPGRSRQSSIPFKRFLSGLASIFSGRKPAMGDDLVRRVTVDWHTRHLPQVKTD